MSQSASIRETQELAVLRTALGKLAAQIKEVVAEATASMARELAWVDGRVQVLRQECQQAEQELRIAQLRLARCWDEDRGGCSAEQRVVARAERERDLAVAALHRAEAWRTRIEREAFDLRGACTNLESLSTRDVVRSRAYLDRLLDRLMSYTALAGGIRGDVLPPVLGPLARVFTAGLPGSEPGEPDEFGWVDMGFQYIEVDRLPMPADVGSEEDFSKGSAEELEAGFDRLQEIRATLERGEGASLEYWAERDHAAGLDPAHGYEQCYGSYFTRGRALVVEWDGQKYDIVNGGHRIWLAKQCGQSWLPTRLKLKA